MDNNILVLYFVISAKRSKLGLGRGANLRCKVLR